MSLACHLLVFLALASLVNSYQFKTLTGNPPLVIGHRGACGYRPEHTFGSHELAIDLGADVVEVDIVSSKDRSLIIMHENELSLTTDVENHPEFQWKKTAKVIDGIRWTGWFVEDFTLAELKTLRVQQDKLKPFRTRDFDGLWQIPTLNEIAMLIRAKEKEKKRTIGLFVELKKPSYFRALNLSLEEPLVEILTQAGYQLHTNASWEHLRSPPPLLLESFDPRCVQFLSQFTLGVPLTQLIHLPNIRVPGEEKETFGNLTTDDGLRKIRSYATGIGIISQLLIPVDEDYLYLLPATDIVSRAHAADLLVHVWTFRSDAQYLNPNYKSPEEEYVTHFQLGIDGAISDFPDTAFRVRKQLLSGVETNRKLAPSWLALSLLTAVTLLFLSFVWVLRCAESNNQENNSNSSRSGKPLALSGDEDDNVL